jgi:4-carboxymuconolactone decarboxylase
MAKSKTKTTRGKTASSKTTRGRSARAKSRTTRTARPLTPRLKDIPQARMSAKQRTVLADIQQTRGKGMLSGPFSVMLHAPDYGDLAQKLGAFCRYRTGVPPRLSEFAILVIASLWRSQYEFWIHAPIAEKAGVSRQTIADLRARRRPTRMTREERAIYDFITELHRTRRVSEPTYRKVQALLGDAGTVEFTGILGYYTLVAMSLNVFNVPLPVGEALPFREA